MSAGVYRANRLEEDADDRDAAFTRQNGRKTPECAIFSGPVILPRKRSAPLVVVALKRYAGAGMA